MMVAGLWHTAETVADLARSLGIDAAELSATVDRFNELAEHGTDEDFHRGEDPFGRFFVGATEPAQCLQPLGGTRFHAVRLVLGDLGTKGGAVIDRDGAVQRADGSPITGLYAAGNSSASISGEVYPATALWQIWPHGSVRRSPWRHPDPERPNVGRHGEYEHRGHGVSGGGRSCRAHRFRGRRTRRRRPTRSAVGGRPPAARLEDADGTNGTRGPPRRTGPRSRAPPPVPDPRARGSRVR
ncbi:FAD-binding protein [Nocardia sp. NPDC050193]